MPGTPGTLDARPREVKASALILPSLMKGISAGTLPVMSWIWPAIRSVVAPAIPR